MKKLNCTRQEIVDKCPPEYYCDYITWLSKISGAIAVWCQGYQGIPNKKQLAMLKIFKMNGIYHGSIT